jgi:hypothetical protein
MDQIANFILIVITTWCGAIFLSHITDAPLLTASAGSFFILMALKS